MILHSRQIQDAVVEISCNENSGTAFAISQTADAIILLTAYHTVDSADQAPLCVIQKDLPKEDWPHATVLDFDAQHDVALLSVPKEQITLSPLTLSAQKLPYDEDWETFGFPACKVEHGGRYTGKVLGAVTGEKWDADLSCDQQESVMNFEGLSGGPLVIDGHVRGVITYQLSHSLGGVSVFSFQELLKTNGISFLPAHADSVPVSIAKEAADTYENRAAMAEIDEALERLPANEYILVTGSPGSGKTTLAAQWIPANPKYVVCERYFIKVADDEQVPKHIRAIPDAFMGWIEEVYCRILFNGPPQKSNEPLARRMVRIHNGIKELADFYLARGLIGVLVIDGIDDVERNNLVPFLNMLPPQIPGGLRVVMMAGNRNAIPSQLSNRIPQHAEVRVGPLSKEQSKNILKDWLTDIELSSTQLDQLAEKAEGHPLYLRYLSRYINGMENQNRIQNFIDNIPVISGHIEQYYKDIWDRLEADGKGITLSSFLARMRIPVEKEELYQMVDKEQRSGFEDALKRIHHLLKGEHHLSIYHSSFSDFIKDRTYLQDSEIHSTIARYCLSNPESFFAVSEVIFQLSHGEEADKLAAIEACNQQWIDLCALKSVIPDVVVEDIRKVIQIASMLGYAPKVIALLLLWQRVNFRYNNLFSDNAYLLVRALIARKTPEEAIRYVIRNKSLIVSDREAIILLQLFIDNGYQDEALSLLEAIDEKCSFYLNDLDQQHFNAYIFLRFRSLSLSMALRPERAIDEFMFRHKKILEIAEESGNDKETVKRLREEILSFHVAHGIYYMGRTADNFLDELESKFPIEQDFSNYLAWIVIKGSILIDNNPVKKALDPIKSWAEEVATCVSRHGYNSKEDQQLIRVLIEHSDAVALLEEMIPKRSLSHVPFIFRDDNGVDLDIEALRDYIFDQEAMGYLNTSARLPALEQFRVHSWEDNLEQRMAFICAIYGRARRYTAEGDQAKLRELIEPLREYLVFLSPLLSQRGMWDRAYGLPEDLYTILYPLAIRVILLFFKDEQAALFSDLFDFVNPQLGLYSEGYVDVLLSSADALLKHQAKPKSIFDIVAKAQEHVVAYIENRWERNEYLLRITEIYALLDNPDRADAAFAEMIATSMGPSWYKEAQLGIINTAMTNMQPAGHHTGRNASFAAHLKHASGEMTFQRYVKYAQEEFIGNLAKCGHLELAVRYFREMLVPSPEKVLENAELRKVDSIGKGKGYLLGARFIEEQSGIEQMLKNLSVSSSLAAWCLIELWMPGDTRYLNTFVSLQINILEHYRNDEPAVFAALCARWKRFVITEVDPEVTEEFLKHTADQVSPLLGEQLNLTLKEVGLVPMSIKTAAKVERSSSIDPATVYLDEAILQVEQQFEMENYSSARKIIIQALELAQADGRFVFSPYSYGNLNKLRDLLKSTHTKAAEVLSDLSELLYRETSSEPWMIAEEMIKLLSTSTDEGEKDAILFEVGQHIDFMVRTPKQLVTEYDYLDHQPAENSGQEIILSQLLVWFLDHPLLLVKNRAIELAAFLAFRAPNEIFPILVSRIVADGYNPSKELAAALFHQLAVADPALFWENFQPHFERLFAHLSLEKHFAVISSILDAVESVNCHGTDVSRESSLLASLFSCKQKAEMEVELEEYHLRAISPMLKSLEYAGFLNGKFCRNLLETVKKLLQMSLADTMRASVYVERSFNDFFELIVTGPYDSLVRYGLNVCLLEHVPIMDREKASEIMRFYQPTFPERSVSAVYPASWAIGKDIKKIIKEQVPSRGIGGNDYLLHYNQLLQSERNPKNQGLEIEVLSFLIPIDAFQAEGSELWQPTFKRSGYPSKVEYDGDEHCIPLAVTADFSLETGCDKVPAALNDQFSAILTPEALDKVEFHHWRKGRSWSKTRYLEPVNSGSAISIPKACLSDLKAKYKLISEISYDYSTIVLDVFENKILKQW